MEMEKDIWGDSWSPEIESRVANAIWEEKYRVSFELIDSSEERISFLKKLIEKTEEEREKLKKEYPVMSPEEREALIEGDRSVDLIYFKMDKEGFVDQLNKDIVSKNLPAKEKQIRHRLLDLINKHQPADEKREQGKVVESRVRGLKAFNELLINKLKIARLQNKIEQNQKFSDPQDRTLPLNHERNEQDNTLNSEGPDELDKLLLVVLESEPKAKVNDIWKILKRELERNQRKYDNNNILVKFSPEPKTPGRPQGTFFWKAEGMKSNRSFISRTIENRLSKIRKKISG